MPPPAVEMVVGVLRPWMVVQAPVDVGMVVLIRMTAMRYRTLSPTIFRLDSDAIHLACAVDTGPSAVYTSDRHMIGAAQVFQFQAITL